MNTLWQQRFRITLVASPLEPKNRAFRIFDGIVLLYQGHSHVMFNLTAEAHGWLTLQEMLVQIYGPVMLCGNSDSLELGDVSQYQWFKTESLVWTRLHPRARMPGIPERSDGHFQLDREGSPTVVEVMAALQREYPDLRPTDAVVVTRTIKYQSTWKTIARHLGYSNSLGVHKQGDLTYIIEEGPVMLDPIVGVGAPGPLVWTEPPSGDVTDMMTHVTVDLGSTPTEKVPPADTALGYPAGGPGSTGGT